MKVSWNWLSELVDTKDITPQQAGDRLTMAGLELEGLETFGKNDAFDSVVVCRIDSIAPHPKADKLVVCQVRTEVEGAPRQIVCGATNMKEGDLVPVALPGTQMSADFEIGVSKLRGVESRGMLCSAKELGLSNDHEGLLILPADLPLGIAVLDALALQDTVLDISLTPNRPDGLSHIGISRELAALFERERRWPDRAVDWCRASRGERVELPEVSTTDGADPDAPIEDHIRVELQDAEGCPRYALAVMTGLQVGPSPDWMRARLMAIGQRPINNLVDVTNYVLHELGQPMHAFDLHKLRGGVIGIRRATEGELITTIDAVERELTAEDVVIVDGEGPIAVAGVMGGLDSSVTEETTAIAIECAYFNPTRVRKTAKRLGLHSESSHRFERGTDPNCVPYVLARAVELFVATQRVLDVTPKVALGTIDNYPEPVLPKEVTLDVARYEANIGVAVSGADICALLERLDIPATLQGERVHARVPTFRPDIERDVDLIEEVARVRGYDEVEPVLPPGVMGFAHEVRADAVDKPETIVKLADESSIRGARQLLLARGLREAVNFNFIGSEALARLAFAADDVRSLPIAIQNPITEVANVMRTTLVQGLLTNLAHNRAHQKSDVRLFEVGRVYLRANNPEVPVPDHVGGVRWGTHVEPTNIAAMVTGDAWTHFAGNRLWDAFDLVALVRDLVSSVTRKEATITPCDDPAGLWHPYTAGRVLVEGAPVGEIGAIHPELLEAIDIDLPVYAFELDLDALLARRSSWPTMSPIPRFPSSQRDFALTVDASTPYSKLEQVLDDFGDSRIVASALFDVYAGEQLGAGKKSFAIRLTLQDPEATLSEEMLSNLQDKLVGHLERELDAKLR